MDGSERITDDEFLKQLHKLDDSDRVTIMANMILIEKCRLCKAEPPDLEIDL